MPRLDAAPGRKRGRDSKRGGRKGGFRWSPSPVAAAGSSVAQLSDDLGVSVVSAEGYLLPET